LVTSIFSAGAAASTILKNVGGDAAVLAAGNPVDPETVQLCDVPALTAVVPPLLTVVLAWLANSSMPAMTLPGL
jgi:hypothetical protein